MARLTGGEKRLGLQRHCVDDEARAWWKQVPESVYSGRIGTAAHKDGIGRRKARKDIGPATLCHGHAVREAETGRIGAHVSRAVRA